MFHFKTRLARTQNFINSSILSLFRSFQVRHINDIDREGFGGRQRLVLELLTKTKNRKMMPIDQFFDFNDNRLVDN